MVGRDIKEQHPKVVVEPGEVLLRVRDLPGRDGATAELTVHAGEIVALAGLVGSGRTELGGSLWGLGGSGGDHCAGAQCHPDRVYHALRSIRWFRKGAARRVPPRTHPGGLTVLGRRADCSMSLLPTGGVLMSGNGIPNLR